MERTNPKRKELVKISTKAWILHCEGQTPKGKVLKLDRTKSITNKWILRAKHKTATPTIYDFVDSHDMFKKQYLKRKTIYKKNGYKIIETDNNKYSKDINNWKNSDKFCSDNNEEKETILNGKCLINFQKYKT